MASGPTKRIALDRRVCVVKPGSVTIRPTRSAILLPAVGLLASVGVFAVIARFGGHPFGWSTSRAASS